ncbi:hypothetical protein [Longispora albida]|uniref:hypothetical protein n=1 Tax=Longispora albida TaxID=203523 RepID=UPI0003A4AA03|nr:hypothetical protein [Longispora albida]
MTMHLITLRATGPRSPVPDPAAVTGLLWEAVRDTDHIEHLRIRASPGQLDLAVFLLAEHEAAALLTARALCARALHPTFTGWRLAA